MNIQVRTANSADRIASRLRTTFRLRISPPFSQDGSQARVAWLLNTLILAMVTISLLSATIPWLFTPHIRWRTFLPVVGLLPICFAAHALLHREKLTAAATILGSA